MKIITLNPVPILTCVLILGFLPLALSNSNLQKISGQATSEQDSTQHLTSPTLTQKLPESVYRIDTANKSYRSVFDDFLAHAEDDIFEFTLTTDLQKLLLNDPQADYQPAYLKDRNETFEHRLKVKPRGKFRRRICDFPPLKLNFSKDRLNEAGLHGDFDKLKLVTHCVDEKGDGKDNVLREYLTYQMYNTLTDNSYRVLLVKIKYVDLHNSMRPITRYGFLIEDTDEMAARLNGSECECHGLSEGKIAYAPANLTAMFQYMIGNEDWDIPGLRNVKAVKLNTGSENDNLIVPYDFDFSGVVNAEYAVPDPDLHHSTVQQRHFFGRFASRKDFDLMSAHFMENRQKLIDLVRKFKLLRLESRLEIINYLNGFFLILEEEHAAFEVFGVR